MSLILIVVQYFTLVCHDITHPPYDHSIFCPTDRLKRTNSNSLHNFHSFHPRHSQSSYHKDFSLPAPLSSFQSLNDFKIPPHISQQWQIPYTHSLITPPHLKHPFLLARCSPHAPEFSRSNLHNKSTECQKYELVCESKKVYE